MNSEFRIIANRHRPLLVTENGIYTYYKNSICFLNDSGELIKKICEIPSSIIGKIYSNFRLTERLMRLEIRASVTGFHNDLYVARKGFIYNVNLINGNIKKVHAFCKGMSSPYYFCKVENVKGFDDCILYGEYKQNNKREEEVNVVSRAKESDAWETVYTFAPGTIRHIHGIIPDYENNCLYILTGDRDNESGIWIARNGFKQVIPLVMGSQQVRAVFLSKANNSILYATDTPSETNYIYKINILEDSPNSTPLYEINGSCILATDSKDYIFFSSTVEPDETISGWKSWINYKLGKGIKNRSVVLYLVQKKDLLISPIMTFKKDILPYKLFQYGQCYPIWDEYRKRLLVYPIGVKKYDGKLITIV